MASLISTISSAFCEAAFMKVTTPVIQVILAIFTIGFLPKVQAVVPAPDGGYPGGNTAEGQNALLNLTTGGFNTALGFLSLKTDATGQLNTAVGAGTLLTNTSDNNTAVGAGALLSNTTGSGNKADGGFALFSLPVRAKTPLADFRRYSAIPKATRIRLWVFKRS